MMKNVITFLSIALLSTVVNAERNLIVQETTTHTEQHETNIVSDLVSVKNEENDLELWKILDTNQDKSISKIEASASIAVFDNWDKLDANKDENIDTLEFAQLYSLKD